MSIWAQAGDFLTQFLSGATHPAPVARPTPPAAVQGLQNPAAFFDAVRAGNLLGPVLTTGEVGGCNAILDACKGLPLSWAAYALATAYHETAHTLQPIREIGNAAYFTRMYDITGNRPAVAEHLGNTQPGDGVKFCGRGYVQDTGRGNYKRAGDALGLDLVNNPDAMLHQDVAAKVMRLGMVEGWFSGKGFNNYLPSPANVAQFTNARHIINGSDRAALIASYAMDFQSALKAGAWA